MKHYLHNIKHSHWESSEEPREYSHWANNEGPHVNLFYVMRKWGRKKAEIGDKPGLAQIQRKKDWMRICTKIVFSGNSQHLKEMKEERHSMPIIK